VSSFLTDDAEQKSSTTTSRHLHLPLATDPLPKPPTSKPCRHHAFIARFPRRSLIFITRFPHHRAVIVTVKI